MAKDSGGMGTIVKVALVGGAAYLAWSSGLLSAALAALGIGTAAAAATTTPPAGTGTTGTLPTGGGGSTNTGAAGSGSSPTTTPPPATPASCAAVSFTCPDGSVLTQTPSNPPTCSTPNFQCANPTATQSAANTAAAGALALALNARALSDGVAQGATILQAVTGYPNGQVLYTPQQWNFIMREIYPSAGVVPSSSQAMPSSQYVLLRLSTFNTTNAALGLSGIRPVQQLNGAGMRTLQRQAMAGDLLAAAKLRHFGVPPPRIMPGSRLRVGRLVLPGVAR